MPVVAVAELIESVVAAAVAASPAAEVWAHASAIGTRRFPEGKKQTNVRVQDVHFIAAQ